jgi:hypothetical protein
MRTIIAVIGLAAISLSSCSPRGTACDADKFFCSDPNTWEKQASNLPTDRLMQLHAIDWQYGRPPTNIFSRIMGARGEETLKELAIYMQDHPNTRSKGFYAPIISEVSFSSHVAACRSQFRQELQDSIGNVSEITC